MSYFARITSEEAHKNRSFRHSSSGQPLLNIDVAFSAFLAAGPALEVIAKILNRAGGRGGPGNRNNGGYGGGIQNQDPVAALHVLEDREFTIIKHKLRGAKVSYHDLEQFVSLQETVHRYSSTKLSSAYCWFSHQVSCL